MGKWEFLVFGYLASIFVETLVLLAALSPRHPISRRLFAGAWLTACTYPIVIIVLPELIDETEQRVLYLVIAETFAPVAECALFWMAFGDAAEWGKRSMWRDLAAIVLANLASFGAGQLAYALGWRPQSF